MVFWRFPPQFKEYEAQLTTKVMSVRLLLIALQKVNDAFMEHFTRRKMVPGVSRAVT